MNNGDTHELAAERQEKLAQLMRQRGVVRVEDLAAELSVSAATVRRDLRQLEHHGLLRRVHGGAVSVGGRLDEPLFDDKTALMADEKRRIAEAAYRLIEPEESIYLDGGSTVLTLARMLVGMSRLTVVTNSLRVAGTLSGEGPRLIVVGGELRRRSQTFVGALSGPVLEELHVDKAFMGTIGMSIAEGLTTTDPNEALTKQLVARHADQLILLADSGKVGKVAFARASRVEDLDVLITDKDADAGFLRGLKRLGVKVLKV